jgi:hypothetical protein
MIKLKEILTKDNEAKRIANLTFPNFKGTTYEVLEFPGEMRLDSYWSDGSRNDWVIINLLTGKQKDIPENGTPFSNGGKIYKMKTLPPNFALVRHYIGRIDRLTIYVNKENLTKMLPEKGNELSWIEKVVLVATRSLKNSYGGETNIRFKRANRLFGITPEQWKEAQQSLIKKRMLNSAGAITMDGRNAAGHDQLHQIEQDKQIFR